MKEARWQGATALRLGFAAGGRRPRYDRVGGNALALRRDLAEAS